MITALLLLLNITNILNNVRKVTRNVNLGAVSQLSGRNVEEEKDSEQLLLIPFPGAATRNAQETMTALYTEAQPQDS